jgi:nicotinate-nucleotide pyrophosphorylase (carboxylating)
MLTPYETEFEIAIKRAIQEDIGDGDHSSLSCLDDNAKGQARLLVKESGILAGVEIAERIFKYIDSDIQFNKLMNDGDKMKYGDIAFTIAGKSLSILKSERIVLNCMQRMSGIATKTKRYADKISDLKTKVLDTRKTTPGFRYFEKTAVKIGGGENHRFGLYDMIMLKDNHIDYAGGIEQAIKKTHQYLKDTNRNLRIEVESRNIDEVKQIMAVGGIHRIMLDNYSPAETIEAVNLINGEYETESSGGITLETIRSYAECGVDYISCGALTHQVDSLDLSLKAF